MFGIHNPDPDTENRTLISSPLDVESFDTDKSYVVTTTSSLAMTNLRKSMSRIHNPMMASISPVDLT